VLPPRSNAFVRYLASAYAILVIYASLFPLSGWRDNGAPLLAFLTAGWPRYYTVFDLAVNVAAYIPLSLLVAPALQPRLKPGAAALIAFVAATAVSFLMETVQNYLPSRVPSNVDLACNVLGGLVGAVLGMRWGRVFADQGGLARWRQRRIVHGRIGDAGIVLSVLWLLTQLSPENLLFGTGDLRSLLGLPAPVDFSADLFYRIELAVAGLGVLSVGLVGWMTMRQPSAWLLGAFLASALATKAIAWAALFEPTEFLQWVTPGNLTGVVAGVAAIGLALLLPPAGQTSVAAVALLAGTALVNLAPQNPYLEQALNQWQPGHFLNFNGLTRLACNLWPFLALAYVMGLRSPRAEGP